MTRAKLTVTKLRTEVKRRSKIIADQRDALRDLISEAEEICNDSDEAIDELNLAVEMLSRNL